MAMLFILAQIRGAVPATPTELITASTPFTKGVLLLLAVLSLMSWAMIFGVHFAIRRARRNAGAFRREFERATRLDEAAAQARRAKPSVLPRMFLRATQFVSSVRVSNQQVRELTESDASAPRSATLTGSQIETLHLLLDDESLVERLRLGRFLPYLATIGSVSPLIGLLGTVLGVISAFIGIATKGSGNLSAVAPGVAEALVATAAALTVAIPATFAYNILAGRLNRFDGEMESFGTAIIALLVREGHI